MNYEEKDDSYMPIWGRFSDYDDEEELDEEFENNQDDIIEEQNLESDAYYYERYLIRSEQELTEAKQYHDGYVFEKINDPVQAFHQMMKLKDINSNSALEDRDDRIERLYELMSEDKDQAEFYKKEIALLKEEKNVADLFYRENSRSSYYARFADRNILLSPEEVYKKGYQEATDFGQPVLFEKMYQSKFEVFCTDIAKLGFALEHSQNEKEKAYFTKRIFEELKLYEIPLKKANVLGYSRNEEEFNRTHYYALGASFSETPNEFHKQAQKEAKAFTEDIVAFAKDYTKLKNQESFRRGRIHQVYRQSQTQNEFDQRMKESIRQRKNTENHKTKEELYF